MTVPATARGARTRSALVAAARTVFERDGFTDSRIADIAREAGCATGSFYTWFASKPEILSAVLYEAQHDVVVPRLDAAAADPYEELAEGHRRYFENYRHNAALMLVLEEVAAVDPSFRDIRRRRGEALARKTASVIEAMQARGIADPSLDPYPTARALDGMVSHLAYYAFVLGDALDIDELVDATDRIWRNALSPRGLT
ncbi:MULTISPECIES: TetR/AcrR family transcriptional regulator [Mumia]|uniref:TetR/AcrR family transcriptional regulator n=1 Tax=Mumia TaxID=1546255 RepID=UPI00141F39AF|nr:MULTISPECIES: TetR/AcrR family transcriptional regulator [unclassified Mumia]QMW67297.1 TetR/AcrR family transcriptional regulator [Mumia sp. ZJ1417]